MNIDCNELELAYDIQTVFVALLESKITVLIDALESCCTCAAFGPMTTCPACTALSSVRS